MNYTFIPFQKSPESYETTFSYLINDSWDGKATHTVVFGYQLGESTPPPPTLPREADIWLLKDFLYGTTLSLLEFEGHINAVTIINDWSTRNYQYKLLTQSHKHCENTERGANFYNLKHECTAISYNCFELSRH